MPKRSSTADPDRHLSLRNGHFTYKRRVPAAVKDLDTRFPIIRSALKTTDIGEARLKRDVLERADDLLWAAYCEGGSHAAAEARYKSAAARAMALGFTYRHISSIMREENGQHIAERLRAVQETKPASPEETAILGGIAKPKVPLMAAFELYKEEIVRDELVGKSQGQLGLWERTKRRAVTAFESVVGPRFIEDITREDALKFYRWWLERVAPNPKEGKIPTHSPSSANRDMGNLRVLYESYCKHYNELEVDEIKNPFRDLFYSEKKRTLGRPFRLNGSKTEY